MKTLKQHLRTFGYTEFKQPRIKSLQKTHRENRTMKPTINDHITETPKIKHNPTKKHSHKQIVHQSSALICPNNKKYLCNNPTCRTKKWRKNQCQA